MDCLHYSKNECRQCDLKSSYAACLESKTLPLLEVFPSLEIVDSPWQESRYRAKFSVGLSQHEVKEIIFGAPDSQGRVEYGLSQCELYPKLLKSLLTILPEFFRECRVSIYNVEDRTGELKFVQIQQTTTHELMLTIILRSKEALERIQKKVSSLQKQLPQLTVIAVGIQSQATSLQLPQEIIYLSERKWLEEKINGLTLFISATSFFQTNPHIASKLYLLAQEWAAALEEKKFIDAYSGVGGFAFHLSHINKQVIAHEMDPQAVTLAKAAALKNEFLDVEFWQTDLEAQSIELEDYCLIVNPPRRGLSQSLIEKIQGSQVPHLFYSSCNPETLLRDLQQLDKFKLSKAFALDMFPMNKHLEVVVTLVRK